MTKYTAIKLFENLDFLKKPVKPREYGIELWYAGGKNVEKLKYADTRGLPIFYSCDWDYDGLFVIYPLVKEKISTIELLIPNGLPRGIDETEHDSKWQQCNIIGLFSMFSSQKSRSNSYSVKYFVLFPKCTIFAA